MLQKRTRALKPEFTFAGFTFPRYLATLPRGTLQSRFKARSTRGLTGDYYSAPTPNNSDSMGFYLDSDGMPDLRWQWCDDVTRSIRHNGWFCYEDGCGETIRGIVFRLPHGRGFLAGWSMGEGMASRLDYNPVFDNEADAAQCADSMAESAAESERQYQADEQARIDAEESDSDDGE